LELRIGLTFKPIFSLFEKNPWMEILELKVIEGLAEDVGKGLARLDPEDMKKINGVLGDLIEVEGE